ncbi:MAG: type IV pilus secretin PilQ [Myxococcales bacterium]|nr:type IV pilus secretin PilQ [Myxococcales bacterium]
MRSCLWRLLPAGAMAVLLLPVSTAMAQVSPAASVRQATNEIRGIDIQEDSESTVITIHGDRIPTFTVFKLQDPIRLFVDIANADVGRVDGTIEVRNGVISDVGTLQFRQQDAPVGRIVVVLERENAYNVVAVGNDIRVTVDATGRVDGSLVGTAPKNGANQLQIAIDRERELLQQIKIARLQEEQLRDRAATARKQEDDLRVQIEAARVSAEKLRDAEQAKLAALMQEQDALARVVAERDALQREMETTKTLVAENRSKAQLEAELSAAQQEAKKAAAERDAALAANKQREDELSKQLAVAKEAQAIVDAQLQMEAMRVQSLETKIAEVSARKGAESAQTAAQLTAQKADAEKRQLALQAQLGDAQKTIRDLQDAMVTAVAVAHRDAANQKQALEAALARAAATESGLREEQSAYRASSETRLTELEAEVIRLRERVDARQSELSETLRRQEKELKDLELAYQTRRKEVGELDAEVGVQEAKIRALSDKLTAEQEKLRVVTAARQAEEAKVSEVAAKRREEEAKVSAVAAQRQVEEQKLASLQGKAKSISDEIKRLEAAKVEAERRSKEAARSEKQVIDTRVAALEARLAQERAKGAKNTSKLVSELQQKIKAARAEGEAKAKQLESALSLELAGLERSLVEAKAEAAASEQREQALSQQVNKLEVALSEAKSSAVQIAAKADARVSEATERERSLVQQIAQLQQEFQSARVAAEREAQARASQQRDEAALREQIARMQQDLAVAQAAAVRSATVSEEDLRGAQAREALLQTRIRTMEEELQKSLANQATATELALARKREVGLEIRLAELQSELSGLRSAADDSVQARKEVEDAKKREAVLQNRLSALENEIDGLKAEAAANAERASATSQSASTVQMPAVVTGPVAMIRHVGFDHGKLGSRVELAIDGDAQYKVIEQSSDKAVLLLPFTSIPQNLERSLDTTDFGGPVTMVSTYRSVLPHEEGSVRVVVNLRSGAPNRLVRGDGKLIWQFDPVESSPSHVAAKRNESVPGGDRIHYFPNMVGQAAAGGGAPAAAAGAGAGAAEFSAGVMNPYFDRKKKKKKYTGKRINLTIKDADVQHVLTFIAKEGKVNIVAGDQVKGKVTFHLEDIPWDLALDMILKAKGLDYVKEQGVYRVAPAELINKEVELELDKKKKLADLRQLVVRLIPVNYSSAEDLSGQITKILSAKGNVTVDKRTNTLIVKDTEDYIVAAEDLVRRLDTQTPQVLIEARIVEASTAFTRNLGIQWGGNFAMSPAFGNETGLSFPSIIGISGGATGTGSSTDGLFTNSPGFAVNLPAPVGPGSGGALGLTLGNLSGSANLSLRLSAQEEEGNVKIISSPRISTLDNGKAMIKQGVSIPISVVSAQGVNTQFFNADLQLEVTPHVTQDGNIALKVYISKNEPNFGQTGANGNPTIQKKEAQTELLLRDGDTTVIGGIYTRNYGQNYSKVPLLGDIPILGWLFKSKGESDNRSELLIFITPRIINRPAAASGAAR